jgi:hypothetical protein
MASLTLEYEVTEKALKLRTKKRGIKERYKSLTGLILD